VARRTTLTLEDEVMDRLLEQARRSKRPFKQVVNEALRKGLDQDRAPRAPFQVQPRNLGLREGFSLDSVSSLLDQLEGPEHR
jgi:hypothetical protein